MAEEPLPLASFEGMYIVLDRQEPMLGSYHPTAAESFRQDCYVDPASQPLLSPPARGDDPAAARDSATSARNAEALEEAGEMFQEEETLASCLSKFRKGKQKRSARSSVFSRRWVIPTKTSPRCAS